VDPQLALCAAPDESKDVPVPAHDPWYLVDESTGVTENHQQLTLVGCKKNHTEIVAFSLWDMIRKFRVKAVGKLQLLVVPACGLVLKIFCFVR